MARRKKNAPPMNINQKCNRCDKVFKRPCDFNKHEKTHSRPWKCTEPNCKYFQIGWPGEKERDRHFNDTHSDTPNLFKCQYQPCTYACVRESNCKQHMEKAHGWVYVRSKKSTRGGSKRGSYLQATPRTSSVSTPASNLPISVSAPNPSLEAPMFLDCVPFYFIDPPAPAHSDDYPPIFGTSLSLTSSAGMDKEFNWFPTSLIPDAFQAQFEADNPNRLTSDLKVHRQSMESTALPSAKHVPDLVEPSMSSDESALATTDSDLTMDAPRGYMGYGAAEKV
ncbi:hypothetical protein N7523_001983 [Penicillium sp. IBT 18751x]|nr:hypothetical protein N7523_001983 [Penicillium sp. IBT 18751x]